MNYYVKSVFFALIIVLIAWDIACFAPQGSVTIHNAGNSASFIQQESNLQTFNQNVPSSIPNQPISNRERTQQSNTQIQNSRSRDYVNPNFNRDIATSTVINNINPVNNGGGIRDYNNPAVQPNVQQSNTQIQNSGSKDYVNPNFNRGFNPSNSRHPTSSHPSGQISIIATTPKVNTRDYVGPVPSGPQNSRPNFPSLPSRSSANPQGNTGAPKISYANKVIEGITTKSSIPKTKASSGPSIGPTPTTEKPDEGPTDTELRDFSEALLRRDVNNAAKFITVNYQGKTTSQSQNDEAPQKLLEVKYDAFQIPTISKLKLLYNNYILDTNQNEHITAQEKNEENELLDTMLTTPIMQFTKNFLISKGKISKDPKDFKTLLKMIWFNMYSRGGGRIGSSGFEHIFLAELKKNEVSGLHNWVYFDYAELNKIVDYLGYMKKIDLGEKGAILKFHFKLNGVDKPVDSMFIGTSPELEIALYTTCYLFRADRVCPLRLNGHNFIIRTYNFRYRGKNMIGSAFPEI